MKLPCSAASAATTSRAGADMLTLISESAPSIRILKSSALERRASTSDRRAFCAFTSMFDRQSSTRISMLLAADTPTGRTHAASETAALAAAALRR